MDIKYFQEIEHRFYIVYLLNGKYEYAVVDNVYGFRDMIYAHNIKQLDKNIRLRKHCEMLNNRIEESV